MKLTKLLPLTTIVTATSVIVPMSVSCGTHGNEEIVYENVKTETLFNKQFARTTDIAKTRQFLNSDGAFDYYLAAVKDNHKIYTDDVFLSAQDELAYWLGTERSSAWFDLNGFVGNVQFGIANVSVEDRRLSFGIKLDTTIEVAPRTPEANDTFIKFNLKLNMDAKDIKFALDQKDLGNKTFAWWLHPAYVTDWKNPYEDLPHQTIDPWLLSTDKNWSLNFDGQIAILDSVFPELQTDFALNGKCNWECANDSAALYLFEMFYSILWHRVDYLSQTYIE